MTNDDEGGEGVSIPPKNDDVIYEQPLTCTAKLYNVFSILCRPLSVLFEEIVV